MSADVVRGILRFLGNGGGLGDELRDRGCFDARFILEDEDPCMVEGIVADLDGGAMGCAGDGVFIRLKFDLAVLGDGPGYA
jgi:hypothetical protein